MVEVNRDDERCTHALFATLADHRLSVAQMRDASNQAFATHRETAEQGKAKLVEALERLDRWFDTDDEILAGMDSSTLADHKRQHTLIRQALKKARQ